MIFNTLLTIALTLLACANCFTSQLQQNRDELLDKPVEAYDHVPEHKYVETRDVSSLHFPTLMTVSSLKCPII
jgi:hypothetical protein